MHVHRWKRVMIIIHDEIREGLNGIWVYSDGVSLHMSLPADVQRATRIGFRRSTGSETYHSLMDRWMFPSSGTVHRVVRQAWQPYLPAQGYSKSCPTESLFNLVRSQ